MTDEVRQDYIIKQKRNAFDELMEGVDAMQQQSARARLPCVRMRLMISHRLKWTRNSFAIRAIA